MAIFSGDNSKKYWKAVDKAMRRLVGVDILYEYGCKAQELEAENERLKEKLGHILTCLTILRCTKSEEGIKDLPEMIAKLYEEVEQAEKGTQ